MKNIKLFILSLGLSVTLPLLLVSCASQKIITAPIAGDRLFPYGKYQHQVSLKIPAQGDTPEKSFDFRGVVQVNSEVIRIVVISFLGTTAFKMSEDLKTGEIKTDVYIPQMKRFEPKLKEYYSILREILMTGRHSRGKGNRLKWTKINEAGFPVEMETLGLEQNATFKILSFDKNNIPLEFVIEHPHFNVDVKVVGYEI